jgi:hypothetical protein
MFGCVGQEPVDRGWYATHTEKPRTRDEAQRFMNHPIVSVRYRGEGEDRYVHQASVWDGRSYKDDYFCSTDHAQDFAYAVVQMPGNKITTQAYRDAHAAQARKSGV